MASLKLLSLAVFVVLLFVTSNALSVNKANRKAKVTVASSAPGTSLPPDATTPGAGFAPMVTPQTTTVPDTTPEIPPEAGTKTPPESSPSLEGLAGMGIAVVLKNRNHIKTIEDKSAEAIEREESRKHLSEEQRRKEHYRNLNEKDSQLRRDTTALEQTDRADRLEAQQKLSEEQDQKQTVREQTDTRERNSEAAEKKKAQLEKEEKERLAREEQGDKERQKQRDKELEERIKKDVDEKNGVIEKAKFKPQQGRILRTNKELPFTGAYSYLFWYKPLGTNGGWSNILHKGNTNEQRSPAVWMYPGRTDLHIRSGIFNNLNEGCDPGRAIPLNTWVHVAIVHNDKGVKVYYDGNIVCDRLIGQPVMNDGPLYVGDPWHPAANCELADFRFVPRAEEVSVIQQAHKDRQGIS